MGVPGSRLNLRVAQQFPDDRESLARGQRPGSIPVLQVGDAHAVRSSAPLDAFQVAGEVQQMRVGLPADYYA